MNDSRRKYKGARTIKKRSFGTRIRKRNRSYARTLKGGGWGKSKSPEDKAATNQAKKEKEDAKKIAKDEQKKKEADKKAAEKEADTQKIQEGNQLIFQKLVKILESKGLKPMEDLIGQPFNPDTQEAITQIPSPSPELKGAVVDVVEKGYFLGEKVVRFAKVVIGA